MQTRQTTSATLLSRVRDASDHVAWREFDERYRNLLLRFCWRRGIGRSDSDDIVQQVFVKLSRSLPGFTYDPERGRFRDYLYRSVRNVISDWARRPEHGARAVDMDASTLAAGGDDSADATAWEEEWIAHHQRMALETVRRTFDERNVAMFERMLAGATAPELAAEFGMSEEALFKVRQRIRDRMTELIAEQIREEESVA